MPIYCLRAAAARWGHLRVLFYLFIRTPPPALHRATPTRLITFFFYLCSSIVPRDFSAFVYIFHCIFIYVPRDARKTQRSVYNVAFMLLHTSTYYKVNYYIGIYELYSEIYL